MNLLAVNVFQSTTVIEQTGIQTSDVTPDFYAISMLFPSCVFYPDFCLKVLVFKAGGQNMIGKIWGEKLNMENVSHIYAAFGLK